MSSPDQPREDPPEKDKSKRQPRTFPKKEAPSTTKDVAEKGDLSEKGKAPYRKQPERDTAGTSVWRRHRPRREEPAESTWREQPATKDEPSGGSSPEHPEGGEAPMSSCRQSERLRAKKEEASRKEIPVSSPQSHGDHESTPPGTGIKAAPPKGDEDSSSPGEACALPPEQYKEIAEMRALQAEQEMFGEGPSTSYADTSRRYPEQPRHRYRPCRDDRMEDTRPRRGRRESLRTFMARKKKEIKDAEEATTSGTGQPANENPLYDPYGYCSNSIYITRGNTGVVYDSEVRHHRCEWDDLHPENPLRLSAAIDTCYDRGLLAKCVYVPNYRRPDLYESVIMVHSPEHFDRLKALSQTGNIEALEYEAAQYDSIYFNRYTFDAACRALSSVLNLVTAVAQREVMNGMAFVRPPGHHAMFKEFNGYCFFNNAAIAAETCIKKGYSKRVLIVDIDVHHGQGTQQMFYERNDVLYFSMHRYEHGHFWPNLAESNFNYIGKGDGLGYNINVPLNATGLTDDDYLAVMFYVLLPVAYEFNPDLIIVSAGYDAVVGCPEGRMNVTPGFYSHLLGHLHGLARGQIAVVLEGGYFIPTLSEAACLTLKTLIGGPCPMLDPIRSVHPVVVQTITDVRRMLHGRWNCFNVSEFYLPQDSKDDDNILKIAYFGQPERRPFETRRFYPENSVPENNYYSKLNKALRERYRASVFSPVIYVCDDSMLLHTPQRGDVERPEKPERLTSILETFTTFGIHNRLVRTNVVRRDWRAYNPHRPDYMSIINQSLPQSKDVYVNQYTHSAVHTAVCCVLTILDGVMAGTSRAGVAVIRPPGHHAEYDRPSGFCFVNNVAVAATYLQIKYKLERILIVDFDIHHGNGTQNMFYNNNHVMYISIHKDDNGSYFPKDSPRSYTYDGHGIGKGFNINIPFNEGKMNDTEYIAAFQNIVLPAAYAFAPQVVLVSAGFDAGINDPLGGYNVNPETFGHLILMLRPLAEGRVVLVLEGGYNLATTSYSMTICSKALLGDPIIMPKNIYKEFSESAVRTIRNVLQHFKKYFHIFQAIKKLPNKAVVVKKVDNFTEDMYTKDLVRTIDPSRIHENDFVENEMRILNHSNH